jgi:ATP-dependent Clp protease ATP-binding subunit ClpB
MCLKIKEWDYFFFGALGALIAGAKYKGGEERLGRLLSKVTESDSNIVLFIDEIHTLVGAGGGQVPWMLQNILKPALAEVNLELLEQQP